MRWINTNTEEKTTRERRIQRGFREDSERIQRGRGRGRRLFFKALASHGLLLVLGVWKDLVQVVEVVGSGTEAAHLLCLLPHHLTPARIATVVFSSRWRQAQGRRRTGGKATNSAYPQGLVQSSVGVFLH